MANSICTTSNNQNTTNSTTLAHQVINGLTDDGLSMAQIITLAMTGYGKESRQ